MNEQSNPDANRWWQVWLDEIESAQPNLERATRAARQLTAAKPSLAQLRLWLTAIAGDVDDPLTCAQCQAQLPDFLAAQQSAQAASKFAEVRTHLTLCPYCAEAYAQSAEWLLAAVADSVPVSQSYPAFDFPFLTEQTPVKALRGHALAGRIDTALAAGRRWLRDSAGGILILFGPSLQGEPVLGWAVKSASPGTMLAQVVLSEEEIPGWEITVAAFAQEGSAGLCQLEVALYRAEGSLEGIPIRIVIGSKEQEGVTDSGGVVIFNDIALARLGDVVVHVGLEG